MIKTNIEAGILALQGFYKIVNTKEKAILLILLWALINAGGLTYRFATVEAVERLMRANCDSNHRHNLGQLKQSNDRSILVEKNKLSIQPIDSRP